MPRILFLLILSIYFPLRSFAVPGDSLSKNHTLELNGGVLLKMFPIYERHYHPDVEFGRETFGIYYGYKAGRIPEMGIDAQYLSCYLGNVYDDHWSSRSNVTEKVIKFYFPFLFHVTTKNQRLDLAGGPYLGFSPVKIESEDFVISSVNNNVLSCSTGSYHNRIFFDPGFDLGLILRAKYSFCLAGNLLSIGIKARYGLGQVFPGK